jgi:Tol biopolymer transport system component
MKHFRSGAAPATLLAAAFACLVSSPVSSQSAPTPSKLHDPQEVQLSGVRQLTFGGENAEAYWSPDGRELIFQSTREGLGCDQIFKVAVDGKSPAAMLSNGKGRTTCAYFAFPAADRIYYASTHASGEACPPLPDRSKGYVWPIYSTYEIYSAKPDGSDPVRLTDNQAYDAEATVCPKDGTILFTSSRDGDLDLYTMKSDGSGVKRLTTEPGYDGGAFFSNDCSQIVWRASRPKPGAELDDFKGLLAQGLVRPSKLEIYVANADGSNARQITYLDAASFAPSFFPDGKRILFSSNTGDPKGREFDIWAINTDGSGLERVTYAPGFDGFPLFSPDGKTLAFASNRNQGKPGETDVYVATWTNARVEPGPATGADLVRRDVEWLADDAREGRGPGTAGLEAAGAYLERRFRDAGIEAAGDEGYRQSFAIPVAVERKPATSLRIDGREIDAAAYTPLGFSASMVAEGAIVPVGYGVVAPELDHDDYAGQDVSGKIVLARRFVPDGDRFANDAAQRRYGDLRAKAFTARQRGAAALIVVDTPDGHAAATPAPTVAGSPSGGAAAANPHAGAPATSGTGGDAKPAEEAELPRLAVNSESDAGIPVIALRRAVGEALFSGAHRARVEVALQRVDAPAFNVVARVRAGRPSPLPGVIVLGAHYDHLGRGGSGSLDPDGNQVHNGADDNASGTAALLEAARLLSARRADLSRDVVFVAFSGEEEGVLGSTRWARRPTGGVAAGDIVAMLNFDMVGRLRDNQVSVLGGDSAAEWKEWIGAVCDRERVRCAISGDGYGPSDHAPFFAAGVPVLHFFSGVHSDYHKPSDDTARLNAAGAAKIAGLAASVTLDLAAREARPTYRAVAEPLPRGDVRASGGSLGTVPDYAGDGRPGVLLAGVRAGGPAEQAGLRRGDLLVELMNQSIRGVEDLMFVLRSAKVHQQTIAVVERDGKRVELLVTFGPPMRMR